MPPTAPPTALMLLAAVATLAVGNKTAVNQLLGSPTVQCGHDGLQFQMETELPFTGQLYVRNEYHNDRCKADFKRIHNQRGSMKLDFNDCGMRRQRMTQPKGMQYSVTMMVKFHDVFVTAMDRAYQIKCFFQESDTNVTTGLDVSPLTTVSMEAEFPLPQCVYTIRTGSVDGPPATFVRIGEPVVHLFHCRQAEVYGMLVKDCYVDDGKKFREKIIDANGCPTELGIIQAPIYSEKTTQALAEASVFKWPDEPAVYFSCQIQLCMKHEGMCKGVTPPDCSKKQRRSVGNINATKLLQSSSNPLEFDLSVNKMIVLDADDYEFPSDFRLNLTGSAKNFTDVRSLHNDRNFRSSQADPTANHPCYGVEMIVGFTVVLTLFILVLIGLSMKLLLMCLSSGKINTVDTAETNSSSSGDNHTRWLWDRYFCSNVKNPFSSS